MITRKFEQEWTEKKSSVNGMAECNVLSDFYEYLKSMRSDLDAIKKYHKEEFDKMSPKPIDFYIGLLKKRTEQFCDVCIKPKYKHGVSFISDDILQKGVVEKDGSKYKINNDRYLFLKALAESVFKIEETLAKPVEVLWQHALTDASKYNKNGKYFLLAHVDYKTAKESEMSSKFRKYNQSLQGLCFSVVSDSKTRLYDNSLPYFSLYSHPNGLVGIIAKPKQGAILGASYDDMLSTEYIDGDCALLRHFDHSLVNRCYQNGNSEIRCRGTKIFPPKNIFGLNIDTINEVVLDSNKIDVVSVFYVKDKFGEKPKRFAEYKREQEKRWGKKLGTIELEPKNKTGQVNLQEVLNDYE